MPLEMRRFTNTRDFERWPWVAKCSQISCYFGVCCATIDEGEKIIERHETYGPCPYDGRGATLVRDGRGGPIVPVGLSLRQMQWELIDDAVDRAMENSGWKAYGPQGEIKGIAACIYLMDQPYWESPGAVMAEAAERLRMRRGEIPKRPTPGCEEPHSVETIVARVKGMVSEQTTKPSNTTRHPLDVKIAELPDKTVNSLIKGLTNGMGADFLAESFSVDLRVVKRIAAQPNRFARTGG